MPGYDYSAYSRYCYGVCKLLLRFREDRRLRLTYKTLECLLQIKTEGTDPVLFDSSRAVEYCHGTGGANVKANANPVTFVTLSCV